MRNEASDWSRHDHWPLIGLSYLTVPSGPGAEHDDLGLTLDKMNNQKLNCEDDFVICLRYYFHQTMSHPLIKDNYAEFVVTGCQHQGRSGKYQSFIFNSMIFLKAFRLYLMNLYRDFSVKISIAQET